jgi:hypothetical protein
LCALQSAFVYIIPQDKLLGKEKAIFAARDRRLASTKLQRKIKRQNQPAHSVTIQFDFPNERSTRTVLLQTEEAYARLKGTMGLHPIFINLPTTSKPTFDAFACRLKHPLGCLRQSVSRLPSFSAYLRAGLPSSDLDPPHPACLQR